MLAHCGIDGTSRVLVLHPMSPWAIGVVFSQAALLCGAQVLPAGITLQPQTLLNLCSAFRPTVICAGARNLLRVLDDFRKDDIAAKFGDVCLVITAGEPLAKDIRSLLEQRLQCYVRDIYGCAELDAIGVEDLGLRGHWLVPDLSFALERDGRKVQLSEGMTGILLGRHKGSKNWHRTGDVVTVLACNDSTGPWGTPLIALMGREKIRVKFGDGSAIGEEQLQHVRHTLGVQEIQLIVTRSRRGDAVELLYLPSFGTFVPPEMAINALLAQCVDFADAWRAGCIRTLDARPVHHLTELAETERRKAPTIIVVEAL